MVGHRPLEASILVRVQVWQQVIFYRGMLTEEKLKEYLVQKYCPLAIILHGSRARGNNRPHSDWDVDLLVSQDTQTQPSLIEGEAVDVMAFKPDVSDGLIRDNIGNAFHSAKVLFDTDNIGINFVKRVRDLAAQGLVLKPSEYQSKKYFLYRTLNRLVDAGDDNPIVFDYQLGKFIERAVNYSFQVDNKWSQSVYEAVNDIQENNPELFKELNIITSNVSDQEKVESAKRIYKLIFKEDFK